MTLLKVCVLENETRCKFVSVIKQYECYRESKKRQKYVAVRFRTQVDKKVGLFFDVGSFCYYRKETPCMKHRFCVIKHY